MKQIFSVLDLGSKAKNVNNAHRIYFERITNVFNRKKNQKGTQNTKKKKLYQQILCQYLKNTKTIL